MLEVNERCAGIRQGKKRSTEHSSRRNKVKRVAGMAFFDLT